MLSTIAISLSAITIQAAIVLAIAFIVVLVVGWRRPIRAATARDGRQREPRPTVRVARIEPERYKRPNLVRRLVSLLLSGAMGILIGALLAIIISFSAALVVVRLTEMLR